MPDHEELWEGFMRALAAREVTRGGWLTPETREEFRARIDALRPVVERYGATKRAEGEQAVLDYVTADAARLARKKRLRHVADYVAALADEYRLRRSLPAADALAAAPPDPQHRHDRTEAGT